MKWCILIFIIIFTNPLLAKCKIDTHAFGTSAKTIQQSLKDTWITSEPIPGVNKTVGTSLELICPELKGSSLGMETMFIYNFIKDKLVAIELVLQTTDKLELFEWGRQYFGIMEERDLAKAEQVIRVEDGNRIIQLFVGVLPDVTFQNVVLISTKHDDLFEYQFQQEDNMNWDTNEISPLEPITLGEEN
ncbi:MAG: hypothetical protein CFH15_00015 [Alphaproteobacteria bacterium MarineAlpha5_Bin5]|nr:MAG: hypothetical protein CFH15_00015 [Alphaproteobacteria bacterium MarineAlpha5_Bin5]PPR52479.1 MAG: hypothetical protein CFH14_00325 [Alphaproteobacteria bacterium MarineAlpha5_Bin4]|tara:strand:- start:382 stop:948 length:567 start_codon:yes stop_codon:yes gene_type:complete